MEKTKKPATLRWMLLAGFGVFSAIVALGSAPPTSSLKPAAVVAIVLFMAAAIAWLTGAAIIQSMLVKARGAAPSRKAVGIVGTLCWIVGFFLLGTVLPPLRNQSSLEKSPPVATHADADTNENAAAAGDTASAAPDSNWQYETTKDDMRGTTMRFASVQSENELQFDFPYAGGSRGTLTVRDKAGTLAIMLTIDKGQFTCNGFGSEPIAVKFDEQPVERYSCVGPSDGTANVIFIRPAQRFLNHLRRSHAAIVEAQFFQEGSQQLSFDTDGLHW